VLTGSWIKGAIFIKPLLPEKYQLDAEMKQKLDEQKVQHKPGSAAKKDKL